MFSTEKIHAMRNEEVAGGWGGQRHARGRVMKLGALSREAWPMGLALAGSISPKKRPPEAGWVGGCSLRGEL